MDFLQQTNTLSTQLVGKELTFDENTAWNLTYTILSTLDLLLPLDQVWASLDENDRATAGQHFLTIAKTISGIVNIHKDKNKYKNFWFNLKNVVLLSEEINYKKDHYINFFGTWVYLPLFAFTIKPSQKVYSAVTVVRLLKLRQYLTPLKDANVCSWVIVVKLGAFTDNFFPIKSPYKLTIDSSLGLMTGTQCAIWRPQSLISNDNWFKTGCNITSNTYPITCKCDHLDDFGFGFFDNSVNLNDDSITTTTTTTTTSSEIVDPDEIAEEINGILGNITSEGVNSTDQLTESLNSLTDLISDLTASDETINSISRDLALNITRSSLNSFSQLIESPNNLWTNMSSNETKNISSNIFKSLSDLSKLMNSKQTEKLEEIKFSSVELHSKAFHQSDNITFQFGNTMKVELPAKSVFHPQSINNFSPFKNYRKVSTALLSNISQRLNTSKLWPNSAILSITLENRRESVNLKNGLLIFEYKTFSFFLDTNNFTFFIFRTQHNFTLFFGDHSQCSFWNLSLNTWSQNGCRLVFQRSNRTSTTCECDHLTNFAVLTDVSNRENQNLTKTILTYFFSSITCIFLSATLYLTLKYNRKKYTLFDDQFNVKTNRYKLNLNVTVWLLISHLLVMGGMDRIECHIVCIISSVALLYSLLTTFSFSLMLSFHLYLATSRRYLFRYFPFQAFAFVAYFSPLLIIVGSLFYLYFFEMNKNLKEMMFSLKGDYL